jgi:hypothetical protein
MSLCHIVPMRDIVDIVRVDGSPGTVAASLHYGVRPPCNFACPLRVTSRSALYYHHPNASMSYTHVMPDI